MGIIERKQFHWNSIAWCFARCWRFDSNVKLTICWEVIQVLYGGIVLPERARAPFSHLYQWMVGRCLQIQVKTPNRAPASIKLQLHPWSWRRGKQEIPAIASKLVVLDLSVKLWKIFYPSGQSLPVFRDVIRASPTDLRADHPGERTVAFLIPSSTRWMPPVLDPIWICKRADGGENIACFKKILLFVVCIPSEEWDGRNVSWAAYSSRKENSTSARSENQFYILN